MPSMPLRRAPRRAGLALLLAAAAFLGACDDTQAPDTAAPAAGGRYDAAREELVIHLESAASVPSRLQLVVTELTLDPETLSVHAWVAVRNRGTEPEPGPAGIVVSDFVPSDVQPANAHCPPVDCPRPDANCALACVFVHEGTYGDDGMLDAGETSTPVEWIFHNPTGESFAFRARLGEPGPRAGTISGRVFVDANGDGRAQASEPGIAGARVALVHGDDERTTTTDERGRYAFGVDAPGLYMLVWQAQNDCAPTTPDRMQVLVVRRADGSLSGFARGDFGCRGGAPGDAVVVAGRVFMDHNRNGRPDAGEPGIPGVAVVGSTPHCPTFVPIVAHTDSGGRYRMRLPACQPPYVVHRQPVPGTVDTSPNPVVLPHPAPPGAVLRADFGVVRADPNVEYLVQGVVFLDLDRNGERDRGEPGVEGLLVTASSLLCMSPIAAQTRTGADGSYTLRGADVRCPLPWSVHRPEGEWQDTRPNPVQLVQPPPDGGRVFRVDFGVAPRDTVPPPPPPPAPAIEGFVFADWNRNGERDRGEPGIANAEVQLVSLCAVLRATRTDSAGRYHFPPGVVQVCPVSAVWQSQPDFAERTTPNPVPVLPGPVPRSLRIDFGVVPERIQP